MQTIARLTLLALAAATLSGCVAYDVASTAVDVTTTAVSTTVDVGAAVVDTAADAASGSSKDDHDKDKNADKKSD